VEKDLWMSSIDFEAGYKKSIMEIDDLRAQIAKLKHEGHIALSLSQRTRSENRQMREAGQGLCVALKRYATCPHYGSVVDMGVTARTALETYGKVFE
jgi:hypothetical protein